MKSSLALLALSFCASVTAWAPSSAAPRSLGSKFQQQVKSATSTFKTQALLLPPQVVATTSSAVAVPQFPPGLGERSIISGLNLLGKAAKREVIMTWGMLQSNLPTTVVLGNLCTISYGLARSSPLSSLEWASVLTKSFLWFLGYSYFNDIGNQLTGIEEDRLNSGYMPAKANRPLATGEMSLEGGLLRHKLAGAYYMTVSWLFGGAQLSLCALLWIVSAQLYNFHGWGDHFATKNYCIMSTGSTSMLLAARAIAGETQFSPIPPILTAIYGQLYQPTRKTFAMKLVIASRGVRRHPSCGDSILLARRGSACMLQ